MHATWRDAVETPRVGSTSQRAQEMALRQSYLAYRHGDIGVLDFLVFSYVVAAIMTWRVYVRRPMPAPGLPNSAPETRPPVCERTRNTGNAAAIAR